MISSLQNWFHGGVGTSLLPDFTLQATVLMIVLAALLRWPGRRWSAARRHALLLVAALLLPCLVPASAWMHRQGLAWAWWAVETPATRPAAGGLTAWKSTVSLREKPVPADENPGIAASLFPNSPLALRSSSPAGILGMIWLAGMALGLGRLLLGTGLLHLVAAQARPAGSAQQERLNRLQGQWAPGTQVRLRLGRSGEVPMTWGFFQHIILLPPESVGWPSGQYRTVLRHELCHVARQDFLWLTLARLACLTCWFHPLAWWLMRELARAAEHACDDRATQNSADRASYAQNLVQVVSQCRSSGRGLASPFRLALAMATPTALRQRVEALMDESRDRTPFLRGQLLWQLPCWNVLLLALATMTACKQEKKDTGNTSSQDEAAPRRETRVYQLSDGQRRLLISGSVKGPPPVDPFAAAGNQPVPAFSAERLLKDQAAKALQNLTEAAHISYPKGQPPEVILEDTRTLVVTTDEATHQAIGKYLARNESGEQVLLRTRILEVDPGWLPWREMGLTEPNKGAGLQVQGVLTAEQGQKLLERIQSDHAVQSMTAAPSVTTRSGQRATVEMVREFIYPTEWEPAQVAKQPAPGEGQAAPTLNASLPIIPTSPLAFEMRPVGVKIEYDPLILAGNRHQIDLSWEITQFLGFINYGTPIKTMAADKDGRLQELVLSENKFLQPIFETMKINTSVQIADGSYVVIGGLKPERTSPSLTDKDASFSPALPDLAKASAKPGMYVLIMQATLARPAQ